MIGFKELVILSFGIIVILLLLGVFYALIFQEPAFPAELPFLYQQQ